MSESNAEIAERVLPTDSSDSDDEIEVVLQCRKLLAYELDRGNLIPKERLMTVEEIDEIMHQFSGYGSSDFEVAKSIHSAMVQKARNP